MGQLNIAASKDASSLMLTLCADSCRLSAEEVNPSGFSAQPQQKDAIRPISSECWAEYTFPFFVCASNGPNRTCAVTGNGMGPGTRVGTGAMARAAVGLAGTDSGDRTTPESACGSPPRELLRGTAPPADGGDASTAGGRDVTGTGTLAGCSSYVVFGVAGDAGFTLARRLNSSSGLVLTTLSLTSRASCSQYVSISGHTWDTVTISSMQELARCGVTDGDGV